MQTRPSGIFHANNLLSLFAIFACLIQLVTIREKHIFPSDIPVFLVAVFSQFLDPQMTDLDRLIMALIAGLIDTVWYVLVAAVLSGTVIIDKLRANSTLIDRKIGTVLLVLALALIGKSFV